MIVVDTSVAAKWFLEDGVDADKAFLILENHKIEQEKILVPDLLFYEIANALTTKSSISRHKVSSLLTRLYQLGLHIYYPAKEDLKKSASLAKKYQTSVYDILYVVVAKVHKAKLITADAKFISQTKFSFVKLLQDQM